jgi:hypothetical protein
MEVYGVEWRIQRNEDMRLTLFSTVDAAEAYEGAIEAIGGLVFGVRAFRVFS